MEEQTYDEDGNCNFCGCPAGTCRLDECTCWVCSKARIEHEESDY